MTGMSEMPIHTGSPRQRRLPFDREKGVETAKTLFHARGFDAVGIAELTHALEINPPSLYAAYGSMIALFERVLCSYRAKDFLPIETILRPGRPPAEALTELMVAAAQHYTRDAAALGCMITEAMQADNETARELASELASGAADIIRNYVAGHARKKDVDRITDYVLLNLRGLSSYARLAYTQAKLDGCSRTAGRALAAEFENCRR